MFNGANGPLNGCGSGRGVIVTCDDVVVGAATVKVRASALDSVVVTRNMFGDSFVESLAAGFSCGSENVEIADGVLRDDALGTLLVPRFGDVSAGVLGTSSSSEGLTAAVGASSAAVCGSGVDASSDEVLSVSVGVVDDDVCESVDGVDAAVVFFLGVDEESAGLVEAEDVALESVGSASATTGMVAAAHPTPSATANAPTRPIYLT
jgi:hypothetical protein